MLAGVIQFRYVLKTAVWGCASAGGQRRMPECPTPFINMVEAESSKSQSAEAQHRYYSPISSRNAGMPVARELAYPDNI
jgi:hypothetical protein